MLKYFSDIAYYFAGKKLLDKNYKKICYIRVFCDSDLRIKIEKVKEGIISTKKKKSISYRKSSSILYAIDLSEKWENMVFLKYVSEKIKPLTPDTSGMILLDKITQNSIQCIVFCSMELYKFLTPSHRNFVAYTATAGIRKIGFFSWKNKEYPDTIDLDTPRIEIINGEMTIIVD